MIILFEKFSWLHFFSLLPFVIKTCKLYVFEGSPIVSSNNRLSANTYRILKGLLPRLSINYLGHKNFPKEIFKANHDVVDFVESRSNYIANSSLSKKLYKLYEDDSVFLGLKKNILLYMYIQRFYMVRMARRLAGKERKVVYLVPNGRDFLKLFKDNDDVLSMHFVTRIVGVFIDQTYSLYQVIRYVGYILISRNGLWGLLKCSLNILLFKKRQVGKYPHHVKYAIQVPKPWGFHQGTERRFGKRYRWDGSFLEDGKEFSGKNLLYIYYEPSGCPADDRLFAENRGAKICEERNLTPTWEYMQQTLRVAFQIFALLTLEWMKFKAPSVLMRAVVSLLFQINIYERFTIYFRPKVYLGFDEQAPNSIPRSIAFKKFGISTADIHHSALGGLYIHPDLAYLGFDRIFAWGKIYQKLFSPYWDNIHMDVVGPLRSDLIYRSSTDKIQQQRFRQKYGNNVKHILICPPGTLEQNLEHRVVDFLTSLQKIVTQRDDLRIIIRPRSIEHISENANYKLIKSGLDSGRIAIELDDFDIWELIAYCDIIISPQTSSVLTEAFAAGKKAFSYSFTGIDELTSFYKLNPFLVATTGEEFINRINTLLDTPNAINNYQYIQDELGQQMDGRVIERIRKGLRRLAESEKRM